MLLAVIPFQKVVVHGFSFLAGFYGIIKVSKGTEVIGFALECDLCDPSLRLFVLIHTGTTAGIALQPSFSVCFKHGDGSALTELQIFTKGNGLQTTAALCFPGLKKGLTDCGGFAAAAKAFPTVHPVALSRVIQNSQLPELLSNILLSGRMCKTAAAFLSAGYQLLADGFAYISAIAATLPNSVSVPASLDRGREAHQTTKALSCEVCLTGFCVCDTSAIQMCFSLKCPGVQKDNTAAYAGTFPDGISVLPHRSGIGYGQMTDLISDGNFGFCD